MQEFWARVSIPVFVALLFGLARRYAPVAAKSTPAVSLEELESKFRTTQWIVAVAMIGIGCFVFVAIHGVLVGLNRYWASLDGPAAFILLPQSAVWWFLPGFAALTGLQAKYAETEAGIDAAK